MPRFILRLKDKTISEITVRKNVIAIGRDKTNDIVLDNPAVSRFHAKIEEIGNHTFYIDDLKSTNGTFVNDGKVVWRSGLNDGDVITVGKYNLTFFHDEPCSPSSLPDIDSTIPVR